MKIKYGCEFWDTLNRRQINIIDKIKMNVMKRVLELPYSTSSLPIQHDCGIIDMSLEVTAEKIIFAAEVLKDGKGI